MQRRVLTAGFFPGQLDIGLVGIERNVLSHDDSVHEVRVICKFLFMEMSRLPDSFAVESLLTLW